MMLRALGHGAFIAGLTMLTQVGGVAWALALLFRRRFFAFAIAYVALSLSALFIAPVFGRVALSCLSSGPLVVQSPIYCALNRQYVTPELRDVLIGLAADMDDVAPGTVTQVLDANFPYFTGFPLLPHLSHHDGRKVDLAFYYADEDGYVAGAVRSPIGYFAFEDGPTECPQRLLSLRWDMGWLQPLWRDLDLDDARTVAVLRLLVADARVGKVFVEPHLQASLGVENPKIRFQGCRASRHDDHIHLQL